MKNEKGFAILALILLVIIGIAAGVVAYNFTANSDEAKLRREADKIGSSDITEVEVDMDIKTSGDYAVVEEIMKNYMNTYGKTAKEVIALLNDEKITQVLTAENYKNDGPDFVATKEFIANTRKDFNEKIDLLISMTSEESMMNAIKEKNLDQKYVDLYREVMIGEDGMSEDIKDTEKALKESSELMNSVLDVQEKVIELLINNKGKWQVNDNGEVEFTSQSLVDEYNGYLNSL